MIKKMVSYGFVFALSLPALVFAQGTKLCNPLTGCNAEKPGPETLPQFIQMVLETVVYIATPILVVFIIVAGFRFVAAQGNTDKLETARKNLTYVIIGGFVILGAFVIANAIDGTVREILGIMQLWSVV